MRFSLADAQAKKKMLHEAKRNRKVPQTPKYLLECKSEPPVFPHNWESSDPQASYYNSISTQKALSFKEYLKQQ